MNLIAAADENWGIGKNGGLLAHISGDMKYFRETTKGKVVVMGRKTLESFPGGKPLKNRVNIVLTQNQDFAPEGVTVCHSMEETLETLKQYPKEGVFIIGGGMIYKAFLPWCEKAYITHVYHTFEADTYLPDLEAQEDWKMASAGERFTNGPEGDQPALDYEFRIYERQCR